ncbi:MAG: glycoside hydrolase family protein [Pseudomonadota bacterium]
MKTSPQGIEFLERHEGVVLKAYRDPVGIWTIGAGLTSMSGVIKVKAGMRLTKKEASRLLAKALERNYEPRVRKAMPNAGQHEYDGGVSFDFNTGAIHRASWVKAWLRRPRDWVDVRRRLKLWNKASGRVLPGLVRRREEEAALMQHGAYGHAVKARRAADDDARVVVRLSTEEFFAARDGFLKLGYDVGEGLSGIKEKGVRAFQRDHDLTVDGIIGRATLSTLQRRLDAQAKVKVPAVVAGGGAAGGTTGEVADTTELPLPTELGWVVFAIGLMWLLWLAYRYRDAIAVKVQGRFPKLATFLRSF